MRLFIQRTRPYFILSKALLSLPFHRIPMNASGATFQALWLLFLLSNFQLDSVFSIVSYCIPNHSKISYHEGNPLDNVGGGSLHLHLNIWTWCTTRSNLIYFFTFKNAHYLRKESRRKDSKSICKLRKGMRYWSLGCCTTSTYVSPVEGKK